MFETEVSVEVGGVMFVDVEEGHGSYKLKAIRTPAFHCYIGLLPDMNLAESLGV